MNSVAAGALPVALPLPASATDNMALTCGAALPVAGSSILAPGPETAPGGHLGALLAATATDQDPWLGWLTLAGLAALWAVGYVVLCAIWPFANCRRCKGKGRHMSPTGKAWRKCRRCRGSGARIRTGRRIWTWLRNKEKEAS